MSENGMNEKEQQNNKEGKNDVKELIMRAVQDPEFRALLFSDPDKALEEYELSDVQKMLIKNLREEDLDMLTEENMEEFFSADAAVYTPDVGAEVDYDDAEEDDI